MAVELFKELFNGKYDGVTPVSLLPVGGIADGGNMRKVGLLGGWKPRKGCALNNTTALGDDVDGLFNYKHPRNLDYHFIAQSNSNLYDATNDPPSAGTTFGSSLIASEVGTTPGFDCVVGEDWFFASGNKVLMWGGDNPFCRAFMVYDVSTTSYVDYTKEVTDNSLNTSVTWTVAAGDFFYVCSPCRAKGITFNLGTSVNNNVETATVKSWVAGAWADRSATDGTLSGGATLAVDGSMTWTKNATDTMSVIGGIMGYWYQVSFSGALDAVQIFSIKLQYDIEALTNKWDGIPQSVTGCLFFDSSAGLYKESLGKIGVESQSTYIDLDTTETADYIYIKTPEPATGFAFGVVEGQANTVDSQVDLIEYWNGSAWTTAGTVTDTTLDVGGDSSFAQTGWIFFNAAALTSVRRTFQADMVPGHWYRVSWDAASLDAQVYFIAHAPFPEALDDYDGCIQFKDRLLLWGDKRYPNRFRYSSRNYSDCFCGGDSGYTDAFGDMNVILNAVRFYNELVVGKKDSIWLLEGNGPENFGKIQIADTIGLASPKSMVSAEVGHPAVHADEQLSVVLWQDVDGIYVLDGRKPKKISSPIDHYFNPEYSECIAAASIRNRQAFPDRINDEYHFLLGDGELVYNYLTDEWFPRWDRAVELSCGLNFKGTDNRWYTYGGTSTGFVCKLESDTTDKNASNADVLIAHSLKTRAFSASPDKTSTFIFRLRRIWAELKAQTSGTITTKTFQNQASAGTIQATPSTISLVNTDYNVVFANLDMSIGNTLSMQIEFSCATADVEMLIYSMMYELEVVGLSGVN